MLRPVIANTTIRGSGTIDHDLHHGGVLRKVGIAGIALFAGCSTPGKVPMQVNITQLANYARPAQPPECQMQVLSSMPLTTFKEVAIVEAWADLKDNKSDVIP